jgi:hypothetical protein
LSVVYAPVARSGVSSFEFALQKGVGGDSPRRDPLGVGIEERGIGKILRGGDKVFEQGAELRRIHVVAGEIAAAFDLHRRGQVGLHHAQGFLMLRNIVGQRAGHGVLQQSLVGDEAVPIGGFDLGRVKIHGHDADQHEHAEDGVQDGDARGCR